MPDETYRSPLHRMVCTTPTDFWNDSCAVDELTYAIGHGAVGATSNPPIVLAVLRKEPARWRDRARQLYASQPMWSEADITWRIVEEMAVRGAEVLHPVFVREQGRKGRLSLQTDPTFYRDSAAIVRQAIRFDRLAPNMQVKIPVTCAGLVAIEEATALGININATVSFTVAQALAVGEAVERGLRRREHDGHDVSSMSPVCTMMVGRLDDWLYALTERDNLTVNPGYLNWGGIACLKKAYTIYKARGYRARLLAAAYRHHLHWSEFIGGDIVLTMPFAWQKRFNASAVEVKPRMGDPVDPAIIRELGERIPDFRRAYDEDGMAPDDFDTYGASVRTLRQFIAAYHELVGVVRDFVLPNPDAK